MDSEDDDYGKAHRLFLAACAMDPDDDGQPNEIALQLLRAASAAWERHLRHLPGNGDDLVLSDTLHGWRDDHRP